MTDEKDVGAGQPVNRPMSQAAMDQLRSEVQRANQMSWGPLQHAVEVVRSRMRADNVPHFDDGVTRSLLGIAIAVAKSNGVNDPSFVHAIVDEVFPQILLTAEPSRLVSPNGKKLEIVKP